MTANVFNIQRFSVHDGDGIRTTVFFSGCPLRCLWCHNPEGESFRPSLLYYAEKCSGCGRCTAVCPAGAVTVSLSDGHTETDRSKCTACGACVQVCRADARAVAGKRYTVDELVKLCAADRMFYEESGGGVTLSGGEVMAQDLDFLLLLLKALRDEDISVNIDTCGFAPFEKFEAVAPFADTFLYDIKAADPEKHLYCTGVKNELIIENLRRLSGLGAKIYIRVPVIAPAPNDKEFDGANFTKKDISGLISIISGIKYSRVCLLPYHNTGEYKRASLSLEASRFAVPSDGELERIKAALTDAGIGPVFIGG